MVEITKAEPRDLEGIRTIYNDAILNSIATFDVEPRTAEQQLEWFESHGEKHPIIVARREANVVGWASLNVFLGRCAYQSTVEDSVYVAGAWRGRGIGKELLGRLIELARELGHHSIVARVAGHGAASVALHRSLGFEEVGTLREAGRKFDRWVDVRLMQLMLD